uniref:Pectin acetylesterase n=1 Tax=Aegilops tauschii TaxID=37682 RepID=M8B3Q3_AEGTA
MAPLSPPTSALLTPSPLPTDSQGCTLTLSLDLTRYNLLKAIGGEYMSVTDAGYLSVLFDVGEIIGGILAGFMSDQLDARATTACARVDDIYSHDPSVVLVTWHLEIQMLKLVEQGMIVIYAMGAEWKGLPFPGCLSSSAGSGPSTAEGTPFFFRGQSIWEAVIRELLSKGLSHAKEVAFLQKK